MGFRAILNVLERRKIACICWNLNSETFSRTLVTISITLVALPYDNDTKQNESPNSLGVFKDLQISLKPVERKQPPCMLQFIN